MTPLGEAAAVPAKCRFLHSIHSVTRGKIDAPRCEVKLEDWPREHVAGIWADPSPDALRTGIDTLTDFLTELVDSPNDGTWWVRCGVVTGRRWGSGCWVGRGGGPVFRRL
jgi:hypothetical protein